MIIVEVQSLKYSRRFVVVERFLYRNHADCEAVYYFAVSEHKFILIIFFP